MKLLSKISMKIALIFTTITALWFGGLYFFYNHVFYFGDIDLLKDHYVIIDRSQEKSIEITKKIPQDWVPIERISKYAQHAIVISEDWSFYEHQGIDLNQLEEAILNTWIYGKKLRGASTISQQVVKNIFFQNDRSFLRKFKELIYTLHLESKLSKKRILEIYLNIIQYGDDLYGIGPAAKFYFKKNPSKLNPKQGAFLAMLLPSPKKYSISFRKRKLTKYAEEIIDQVLHKMVVAKYLSVEHRQELEYLPFGWEEI